MNGAAMAFPQINAATCAVIVTLSLWVWVKLKFPDGCRVPESGLKKQSFAASWAFACLLALEITANMLPTALQYWVIGPSSGLIVYAFGVSAYSSEVGFWSKRRNQLIALGLLLGSFSLLTVLIQEYAFVPLFASLLISHLCQKRNLHSISSSLKDIETLQAKLLKQEAAYSNLRHFDNLSARSNSQKA